jgi:hypothetical protein
MKLLFVTILAIGLISCKDSSKPGDNSDNTNREAGDTTPTSPTFTVLDNDKAVKMILHYRSSNVRVKKPPATPPGGEPPVQTHPEKSTLWAQFDPAIFGGDYQILKVSVFTGAYYENGPKKDLPTMILRIIRRKNTAGGLVDEILYVTPSKEDLCPEPTDCNHELPESVTIAD